MGQQPLAATQIQDSPDIRLAKQLVAAAKAGDQSAIARLETMMDNPQARQIITPLLRAAGIAYNGSTGEITPGAAAPPTQTPWGMAAAYMNQQPQGPSGAQLRPPGGGAEIPYGVQGPIDVGDTRAARPTGPGLSASLQGQLNPGGNAYSGVIRPGQQGEYRARSAYDEPGEADGTGAFSEGGNGGYDFSGGGDVSGTGDFMSDPRYDDTFFGNLAPGSFNQLAGDPTTSWDIYQSQGFGGKGIQNPFVQDYAEDDFKAGMAMGDIFGSSAEDTLGFADQWSDSAIGGGGQYADPQKILAEGLSFAANEQDPARQIEIINTIVNSALVYMSPGQARGVRNQVDKAMRDYITSQYQSGNPGGSGGNFLDDVYSIVGGGR